MVNQLLIQTLMSVQSKQTIVNKTATIHLDHTCVVVIMAFKFLMPMEEPVMVSLPDNLLLMNHIILLALPSVRH